MQISISVGSEVEGVRVDGTLLDKIWPNVPSAVKVHAIKKAIQVGLIESHLAELNTGLAAAAADVVAGVDFQS